VNGFPGGGPPPQRRPWVPKRRAKETYFETKARVLTVTPVGDSADFEIVLVGGTGARLSFLCDALAARRWMDKKDANTYVEIGARQWLRRLREGG